MYATEKQNRGSDCSLIVVSLTTENNGIIHIRKAVAFSDFTFLLQTFCNLLYPETRNVLTRSCAGGAHADAHAHLLSLVLVEERARYLHKHEHIKLSPFITEHREWLTEGRPG